MNKTHPPAAGATQPITPLCKIAALPTLAPTTPKAGKKNKKKGSKDKFRYHKKARVYKCSASLRTLAFLDPFT